MGILEAELEEKDMQLLNLTSQLRQMEAELDTMQHQLALQRETASALEAQVCMSSVMCMSCTCRFVWSAKSTFQPSTCMHACMHICMYARTHTTHTHTHTHTRMCVRPQTDREQLIEKAESGDGRVRDSSAGRAPCVDAWVSTAVRTFGHSKTLHTLLGTGSAALAAALDSCR